MVKFSRSPVTELQLWSCLAIFLAVWSTFATVQQSRRRSVAAMAPITSAAEYSWIDDDFPEYYPKEFPIVQLTPEDTEHYKIYGDMDEQGFGGEEWESQFPLGGGWIRLGPQNRTFSLTHWHALHCLGRIRQSMMKPSGPPYVHTQHCLTYLRELALCRADLTLEPVLNIHGNVDSMYTHECKDWTALYYEAEDNYLRYKRGKHPGIPG